MDRYKVNGFGINFYKYISRYYYGYFFENYIYYSSYFLGYNKGFIIVVIWVIFFWVFIKRDKFLIVRVFVG